MVELFSLFESQTNHHMIGLLPPLQVLAFFGFVSVARCVGDPRVDIIKHAWHHRSVKLLDARSVYRVSEQMLMTTALLPAQLERRPFQPTPTPLASAGASRRLRTPYPPTQTSAALPTPPGR